jgi:hypothetical protein
MLSVPTLFTVFTVNFLSMGLVWIYVARSYPNLKAATYWTASAFSAALGAGISMLRGSVDPLIPIVLGGGLMLFATSLSTMGMNKFYGRPSGWQSQAAIVGVTAALLALFTLWDDDMAIRVIVYSVGQSLTVGMTLPLLFSRRDGGGNAGAAWLARSPSWSSQCMPSARSAPCCNSAASSRSSSSTASRPSWSCCWCSSACRGISAS